MILQPGKYKLLKIYVGEMQSFAGKSLYHALVLKLREAGIAGATVSRGVEAYGAASIIKKVGILDLSADLPMIIEAVDTEEKIQAVLPAISAMVKQGLIFLADAEVIKHG
ncbi:MAG TPA: DUF190 domain-containing protein [Methylomusa anaerophila]|uniref:Uncharacterized protein n=1 Tax=Methylomusa anaerophila TaxID=1930071 RepID=A0A348AM18_9FIRM|nr:DUF190 domain-containing protein [Methylomusa anaerophila]BBB92116.1 hypothetical protein MAMMFC1_02801 [Methylomusa anaerophila]HML87870.1 DUF190 domain-containing protein [Methylomusa anaerophila]